MQIKFGESVRRLRQGKGLTQEALATQLHVSFQTVSKWERGESTPDLTMLPVLARFFQVSTDDLLGVNEAENERRVRELIEAYDGAQKPFTLELLPALKATMAENPLDFRILVRYMECMLHGVTNLEDGLAAEKEVRAIYENIDAHCTNDSIRMRAKRIMVMFLRSLSPAEPERQAEAERILAEMPAMRTCREHIAVMVTPQGEAQMKANEHLVEELLWMLFHALFHHPRAEYFLGFIGEDWRKLRPRRIECNDEMLREIARILLT